MLIEKRVIDFAHRGVDDLRAHDQRIKDALGIERLSIPLSVLKKLSRLAREQSRIPCVIGRTDDTPRLIEVGCERSFSIALDIGTTNLVALLYDNTAKNDLLTRSIENPQTAYGRDIITRLHHTMSARSADVYDALQSGIASMVDVLCREAGITGDEIHAMTVGGNTVMTHFFLGLDVSTIPVHPYTPVASRPGFVPAAELCIGLHPEALVYVFPNAGSYVGGDITAGIRASGMHRSERTSILIDVGTNAEVVIGNHDWMIVGAGAAGPALEEGIARAGRRASRGIVFDVEIKDGVVACRTFDDAAPEGICGSGMVSLVHELYHAGVIDQTGAIVDGPHRTVADGAPAFLLRCGRHEPLVVTEAEIRSFLKSKAAMFTLLLVLTRSVGIAFRDIEQVCVSGALGTGIDAAKAVGIGMLPAWPSETVRPLGNSSLAGARMLLADAALLADVDEIAEKLTYKPMQDDPEFLKEFRGAVFIPHTDPAMLRV